MRMNKLHSLLPSLLVVVSMFAALAFLFARSRQVLWERRQARLCESRFQAVSLALHLYHEEHHCFPPAFTTADCGEPAHSWRVLILPYLGHAELYGYYRFDEPWDGPNNQRLAASIPDVYRCPLRSDHNATTSVLAVVGPETVWPDAQCTRIGDIDDGTLATVQLVEVAHSGIHWMEPRDLPYRKALLGVNVDKAGISSAHPDGRVCFAFTDGRTMRLSKDLPPQMLRGILTRVGGEDVWDVFQGYVFPQGLQESGGRSH